MSSTDLVGRLARLGPRRLLLLVEAAASLAVATFQVRWNGRSLSRLLESPSTPRQATPVLTQEQFDRIAWSINAIGVRLPRDPTCLMRALAGRSMLARRGVDSCIRIGISEDSSDFRAHAWVEVGQQPVLGWIRNERFTVLAQIR